MQDTSPSPVRSLAVALAAAAALAGCSLAPKYERLGMNIRKSAEYVRK